MPHNRSVEDTPLPTLEEVFRKRFGERWFQYEEETLSLEMGTVFSDRMLQKVRLLKALLQDASIDVPVEGDGNPLWARRIESDATFFIHSSDIINNQLVDPEVLITPTSLEIAYTITTLDKLPIDFRPSKMVTMLCEHVLKTDGFQIPVSPFEFLSDESFSSSKAPDPELVENQQKAVRAYIYLMEEGENA